MSQEKFALTGGVQKRAQINYESGERQPDATYLAGVAAIGVDVLYVLTGQRNAGVVPERVLSPEQAALLDNYEHSDEVGKAAARRLLDPVAQRKKA